MTRHGRPRYQEIEAWLTEQCRSLPAGSILPSEVELARQFAVSRMTARQAVQNLALTGRVERRRGSGTFIMPARLHRTDGVLLSFTEDMRRRGMSASSRVLRADVGPSPEDAIALALPPDAHVVVLERIRLADGTPIALERVRLPGEFEAVLRADLETGSLHAALRAIGRQIAYARGYITARLATENEAEHFGAVSPTPLLVENRTIFDGANRPVEKTETAYLASRWVVDTGVYSAERAAAAAAPSAPA